MTEEAQKNNLVPGELPPTENTNPFIVEIDEEGLRKLEVHLAKLWEQYGELADKEGHRLGPDATSIPPRVVFGTEFEIRAGYHLTQEVIRELLEGNEFHMRSTTNPGTGMIKEMQYEVTGKSGRRSGHSNAPQHFVALIEALGLESVPANRPTQELILRPNFPRSINRPQLRELPQPK